MLEVGIKRDEAALAVRPDFIRCRNKILQLNRPLIMGILNLTPDSFSDGGKFLALDLALARAEQIIAEGADFIDLGAESTRPGAVAITSEEEMARLLPVLERLIAANISTVISIDTSKVAVMRAALDLGADMINDVRALTAPGALELISQHQAGVCVMHMQGDPQNMQSQPKYSDVVQEVYDFLAARIKACQSYGISENQVIIDPGFGFGKLLQHNVDLLNSLPKFQQLNCPLLVGLSRKSMISQSLGISLEQRMPPSLALAVLALERGANIIRCHDVAATRHAVDMAHYVLANQQYLMEIDL